MYVYLKRIIDIILCILILIFFGIPMLIISLAIKLEDHGPIFFKQKRIGLNGKEFTLYKFRSMAIDNDVLDFKKENQLTKVGKFIRKTSLDEISQIYNILKGDMSWIGPRPWIPEYYKNFTEEQKHRCDVKPGLTGLAQCNGRNNISIFEKINYDIEYVNNMSFMLDLKIVFLTIKSVLTKEGAELSKLGIKDEINDLKMNLNKSNKKNIKEIKEKIA